MQPQDVEQVCAAIAVDDRNTHLRHDLRKSRVERLKHLLLGFGGLNTSGYTGRLERQPRANRTRAVADQDGRMVNITAVTCLHSKPRQGAQTGLHQRLVDRAGRHRHGDGKRDCAGGAI